MTNSLKHMFVLMLENRSFDHMLAHSKITGTSIDGQQKSINGDASLTKEAVFVMKTDPGHEFEDVLEQLSGEGAVYKSGEYPPINHSGFLSNYKKYHKKDHPLSDVISCYTAEQLPILTALAKEFVVCDNWFSSMPGATWPNRFFVHAATSGGLDHTPSALEMSQWAILDGFDFKNGCIFDTLNKFKKPYRIYRGASWPIQGSIPQVAAIENIQLYETSDFENFKDDLMDGYDAVYTFIEPNYGDILDGTYSGGTSQHPMDDVRGGEKLIKDVYESIRNSPLWNDSVLVITYDEHGGFFDHVTPPKAVPPGDSEPFNKFNKSGFTFDILGVRVPAIIISPLIPKGVIDSTTYDHTSILATLERWLNLPPLTERDKSANDFLHLFTLNEAREVKINLPEVNIQRNRKLEKSNKNLKGLFNEVENSQGNFAAFKQILNKKLKISN